MSTFRPVSLLLISVFVLPLLAQASSFPDLSDSHVFRAEIESLAGLGVIQGNPDGTFRPGDPVNRAAMLKMLYLAAGKTAEPGTAGCFPDVQAGSWYELYVCDAAAKGFVKGYVDGAFKPARPVSRAEALKMVVTVLGVPLDFSGTPKALHDDVATTAWYVPFVEASLDRGILPLRGREEDRQLRPDEPIDRAEAAALIWKGRIAIVPAASASSLAAESSLSLSSSASVASAAGTASAASLASSRKRVQFDDTGATARVLTMTYPFTDTQTLTGKTPFSYRFTLKNPLVVEAEARTQVGSAGLTCTLFRLEKDGLSTEYYIGYTEKGNCYLRVKAAAGDYQLQLSPSTADVSYVIETKAGKGDGNDGFSEAASISAGQVRTGILEDNDLEDWYTFTVTQERWLTFSLTSSDALRCIVYAGSDVDIFGFESPSCKKAYLYPVGTYYVGIGHAQPKALKQLYTVELK